MPGVFGLYYSLSIFSVTFIAFLKDFVKEIYPRAPSFVIRPLSNIFQLLKSN